MTANTICPRCSSAQLERSLHGGLFSDECSACGWNSSGTYSPTITDQARARSARLFVRWPGLRVAPNALQVLRVESPKAKQMSLGDLSAALEAGQAFDLGVVAEYERAQIQNRLRGAGFNVVIVVET